MKKIIISLFVLFWVLYIYDMQDNFYDIQLNSALQTGLDIYYEDERWNKIDPKDFTYTVEKLDELNFIDIDDIWDRVKNITDSIQITWKVLNTEVDKIIVNFKNTNSIFPEEIYTLDSFKKGDTKFEYNAFAKIFRNLDYWLNQYSIQAYIWKDKVSKILVKINIPYLEEKTEQNKTSEEEAIEFNSALEIPKINNINMNKEWISFNRTVIWDKNDSIYIGLPNSDILGFPQTLKNWDIIYPKIKWFVLKKDNFSAADLVKENIWKENAEWYLNKKFKTSIYWNSFEDILFLDDKIWVIFYTLREEWNKYIYEKHYFDFNHSLKWILKIKEFDKTTDNIITEMTELNKKLSNKNDSFKNTKLADELFKIIVR